MTDIPKFCRDRLGADREPVRLAGDASTREWFRVQPSGNSGGVDAAGSQTRVLMSTAEPIDAGADAFLHARRLLAGIGLPVPEILQVFEEEGLVLQEDLGDVLLQEALTTADAEARASLYARAIEHLLVLHTKGTLALQANPEQPAARVALDRERFLFELNFTLEHYVEGLCGASLSDSRRSEVVNAFDTLASEVASFDRVLCHRDYHARNLMVRSRQVGPAGAGEELVIVDFQDARWGPVTYDIASLLYDSYVSLPDEFIEETIEIFRFRLIARIEHGCGHEVPPDESLDELSEKLFNWLGRRDEFRRRFDLTCLQRNLKALGTFGFQLAVRGNEVYRPYVVPTVGHVRRNFKKFPELGRAFEILEEGGALPRVG